MLIIHELKSILIAFATNDKLPIYVFSSQSVIRNELCADKIINSSIEIEKYQENGFEFTIILS